MFFFHVFCGSERMERKDRSVCLCVVACVVQMCLCVFLLFRTHNVFRSECMEEVCEHMPPQLRTGAFCLRTHTDDVFVHACVHLLTL